MSAEAAETAALGAPGGVVEPAGSPTKAPKPPAGVRVTDRTCWAALLAVNTGLTVLRIPAVYSYLEREIPQDVLAEVGDPVMATWALKTGTALAIVLYVFCIGIVALVASAMERRIFPVRLGLGRLGVGVFFLSMLLTVVPVQLYSVLMDVARPDKGVAYYGYMAAVVAVVPLFYLRTLRTMSVRGRLTLYGCVAVVVLGLSVT